MAETVIAETVVVDGKTYRLRIRRNPPMEGVIGWSISAGVSDILVAEGSAYGLAFGKELFRRLAVGDLEFPGEEGRKDG